MSGVYMLKLNKRLLKTEQARRRFTRAQPQLATVINRLAVRACVGCLWKGIRRARAAALR